MTGTSNRAINHRVFVSDMVPAMSAPAPDGGPSQWSPLSHTYVATPDEALVTDPPITRDQGDRLGDWIEEQGAPLRYVFLTHAHADHFLTTNRLLQRFPDATVVATRAVLDRIVRETPNGEISDRYRRFFGDALPDGSVTVHGTAFPETGLDLGGHQLFVHTVGHSDTDDTSVLHVPDLDLVVAGDVVYNNVHQFVGEARNGGLDAWHRALDQVAALTPATVVASHKDVTRSDDPTDIDETRRYLDVAAGVIARAADETAFFTAMKAAFPDRVNPWAIWLSAGRLYPA